MQKLMVGGKDRNREDLRLHIARKWKSCGESFVVKGQELSQLCKLSICVGGVDFGPVQ